MDERQSARAEIDDSRERMKDIAAQLARRAEPTYVKQRAKEAAVEKSMELKNRIIDSPLALGIIGGLTTAGIARIVLNRQHARSSFASSQTAYDETRYNETPYDDGSGLNLGEKAHEMKSQVSEKVSEKMGAAREQAGHLKDQAMHQVDLLRERLPSAHDVKDKAQQITARARGYAGDEPLITALGALAIGAALGFLLPLSQPERRLLAPAREQVGARLESLSHEVTDKVQEKVDTLHEKIVGEEGRESESKPPPSDLTFTT